MSEFNGKVCIVSGAASGIGLCISQRMVAAGATVAMLDNQPAVIDVAARLGANASAWVADVTDLDRVTAAVAEVANRHGRIDYLFNNAGIGVGGEFQDMDAGLWKRIVEVNLIGEFHLMHAVYPRMVAQGSGHIVNVASGLGLSPMPMNNAYVTSKFAVVGMSESLRPEAALHGIHLTVVCPGFVETPLTRDVKMLGVDAEAVKKMIPVRFIGADEAAGEILRAVLRRKRFAIFPGYVGVLVFLYRSFPALFFRGSLRMARRFHAIRKQP